jgi:hypothetical protein
MTNECPYKFYISNDDGKTLKLSSYGNTFTGIITSIYFYDAKSYYIKTPCMKEPKHITKEEVNKLFEGHKTTWLTDEEHDYIERKFKLSQL